MNENVESTGRLSLATVSFRVIVVVAFVVLGAQLWRLQMVAGSEYRRRAEENHLREVRLAAPRGVIYDRGLLEGESHILASNAPIFVVSIVPADLPKGREQEVFDRIARLVGVPAPEISQKVEKREADNDPFNPVPIKYNIERAAALKVEESRLELPGVMVSVESTRHYSEGPLFSLLLGYTALISPTLSSPATFKRLTSPEGGYSINDRIGADGLEEQYEQLLRGRFGRKRLEVEASGRQRELGVAESPRPGSNIVLTLDLELQRFVDQVLREGLLNSPSGVAVVMNPRTGEILALVSQPTYDSNVFTDDSRDDELSALLKDPEQPFFDRAVSGLYPPGSTFKLVTGLAALQEGVATRDTVIDSRGAIYFENDRYPGANASQRLPEWTSVGLGKLNFVQAIANSSNIYFFILGGGFEKDYPSGPLRLGLGNDRIARYARMLGYGVPTGIDLTDEAAGTIPDEAWKQAKRGETWFKGDTYNMSIGQGFVQSTPLQVANATNTIANGGTLYRPHLLRAVIDADGRVTNLVEPEAVSAVQIDQRNLQIVTEAMEAGFSTGAFLPPFRVPGLRVAAKTGTGEFAGEVNAQGELPTHGWFTSFAPADNPQISVTVFVDRGSGSKDAGPIAMRIIRHYFGFPDDPFAASATPVATAQPGPSPAALPQPPAVRPPPAAPVVPAGARPTVVPTLPPTPPVGPTQRVATSTPGRAPAGVAPGPTTRPAPTTAPAVPVPASTPSPLQPTPRPASGGRGAAPTPRPGQ